MCIRDSYIDISEELYRDVGEEWYFPFKAERYRQMRSLGLAPEGERNEPIGDERIQHARQLAELTEAEKDAM
eukprot:8946832-Prorocentrum_lima.AAC.1